MRRLVFLFFFFALLNAKIVSLRIFSVLSAILYLGNVTYKSKSSGRDEGLEVGPPEVLATLSDLLKVTLLPAPMCFSASACLHLVSADLGGFPQVKEELLVEALTKRKTVTVNDKLILSYSHSEVLSNFLVVMKKLI